MRFLVDNALSPQLASMLQSAGHDAVHVRELGMASATDDDVFERAARELRVLLSEDTDFGTLLALGRAPTPSLLLFRHMPDRTAAALFAVLEANLPAVQADLDAGALVVIDPKRVRVRRLPLGGSE